MSGGRAERCGAEDARGETLLRVLERERLGPLGRRQLEHAAPGPAREQAQQIPQVGPGLDCVELWYRRGRGISEGRRLAGGWRECGGAAASKA